jgi:regulator of replication initiation timing
MKDILSSLEILKEEGLKKEFRIDSLSSRIEQLTEQNSRLEFQLSSLKLSNCQLRLELSSSKDTLEKISSTPDPHKVVNKREKALEELASKRNRKINSISTGDFIKRRKTNNSAGTLNEVRSLEFVPDPRWISSPAFQAGLTGNIKKFIEYGK